MNRGVGADYFYVCAGLCARWIPQLRVGKARTFTQRRKVDVLLATGQHPSTEVYTRWEEGRWKIYRVRDADKGYEQPIYDAGAITQTEAGRRKSRRNIRSIKKETAIGLLFVPKRLKRLLHQALLFRR